MSGEQGVHGEQGVSGERRAGSSSIEQPDYWWYRARAGLLEAALGDHLDEPGLLLDVGSADGPSVGWLRARDRRVTVDVDPRGLTPGEGVCASALALPFPDGTFDAVGAFDVVEHCEPEGAALAELHRVLRPGGRLLLSVPAYEWAWTDHDVRAGHHRRYTRPRLLAAVEAAGFEVDRCTYGFAGVFPMFAAERLLRRIKGRVKGRVRGRADGAGEDQGLPQVSPRMDAVLTGLSRAESRLLRRRDLPFGSSVFLAARRPDGYR
ncbi:class I SAM-dependent methyltransferase [Nocardioides sp. GCM10027113]|uniref:class I SAM-dependent methyltransferase n=1 Tax=unclassified Nocardioides TaxID=2615069 RepID=UPI003610D189